MVHGQNHIKNVRVIKYKFPVLICAYVGA